MEKLECKFAIYIPPKKENQPDYHLIKEAVHKEDGSIEKKIRLIKDYQRPFYITEKQYRIHNDKKERENLDKLAKYVCTQSNLKNTLAKVLNKPYSNESINQLSASPYVYGVDISSTTHIKAEYIKRFPDCRSPYSVAYFDTETDVIIGHQNVIISSIVFENKIALAVDIKFIKDIANPIIAITNKFNFYLKEYIEKYDLKLEVFIVENAYEAIKACIDKAHEWKPDFLAIWNLDFDINKIIKACDEAKIDPKHVFSDPSLHNDLKFFKYKQGKKKKVTASGKVQPIPPSSQWHVVECPASFFIVDAMCVYRLIRLAKQEKQRYDLDSILNDELTLGKLSFKEADKYKKLEKHIFMQKNYKLEYIVYNIFDSFSMQLLDNKTMDLKYTMPVYAGLTDFANFKSQPKRISDALYFYLLETDQTVLGSTGKAPQYNKYVDDLNKEDEDEPDIKLDILSLKGWIVTLKAMMLDNDGLNCIKENKHMRSNIRGISADTDCTSSYPSDIIVANVSKETTKREIITIEGIDESVFRLQNINCLGGSVNAVQYCTTMFNFPQPEDVYKYFLENKESIKEKYRKL